jgi:hypothetical protein
MLKQVLPTPLQEREVFLVMHLVTLALKIIPAPQLVKLQSLAVLAPQAPLHPTHIGRL